MPTGANGQNLDSPILHPHQNTRLHVFPMTYILYGGKERGLSRQVDIAFFTPVELRAETEITMELEDKVARFPASESGPERANSQAYYVYTLGCYQIPDQSHAILKQWLYALRDHTEKRW